MDSLSRRYYEHQLGAGMGPEFSLEKLYGYTEPVRRLIQREEPTPQANEIPNTMPSWLPGDDYLINFRKGDPFSKVDQGYARLPGSGYAALHPELKDTKPENYPDIYKLSILADVAPYSREYNIARQAVAKEATNNTQLRIEYEKILERVKQTKKSAIKTRAPFPFPLFATFRIRYDLQRSAMICDGPELPRICLNPAIGWPFSSSSCLAVPDLALAMSGSIVVPLQVPLRPVSLYLKLRHLKGKMTGSC